MEVLMGGDYVMSNYKYMIIWVDSNITHLINRIKFFNLNIIQLTYII